MCFICGRRYGLSRNALRNLATGVNNRLDNGRNFSKPEDIALLWLRYPVPGHGFALHVAFDGVRVHMWCHFCKANTFGDYLYFSGIIQLTIGYGDIVPPNNARFVAILQALIGLVMTVFIFARFSVSLASIDTRSARWNRK